MTLLNPPILQPAGSRHRIAEKLFRLFQGNPVGCVYERTNMVGTREKVRLTHLTVELLRDDVVLVTSVKDGIVEEEEVRQIVDTCKELTENGPYHSILDISNCNIKISEEGRQMYTKLTEENNLKKSQAVVFSSFAKALMVGLIFKLGNYETPHKVFREVPAALDWVLSNQSNQN